MRTNVLVGAVITLAATLVVVLSDLLDLKLESAALLGVAVGAVVALVPGRTAALRLVGFLAGVAVAWLGFVLRAGVFPDSTGGRAVTVAVVLGLCVVVAVASLDRLPLWSTLLGAAALAGAYEYTFAAAPPEVLSTSTSTVTTLLMTSAVGFLVVSLLAPGQAAAPAARRTRSEQPADRTSLDDMMETSR